MARPPLFDYLDAVSIALARGHLSRTKASLAVLIAIESKGTTGEDATIDGGHLAHRLDVTERSVWRYVRDLTQAGWLERTSQARRGRSGKPGSGRRARYGLRIPAGRVSGHNPADGVTVATVGLSDDPAYGLTDSTRWPDSSERGHVTRPPSGGPPYFTHPSAEVTGEASTEADGAWMEPEPVKRCALGQPIGVDGTCCADHDQAAS